MRKKISKWILGILTLVLLLTVVFISKNSNFSQALMMLKRFPSQSKQMVQPIQLQPYTSLIDFVQDKGDLNCQNPANTDFCNIYKNATKFSGTGTFNLKKNDLVLIDPFIFKWTDNGWYRTMEVIWINSKGDPLLIIDNSFGYSVYTSQSPHLSAHGFQGIYFMTDLNKVMDGDETNFTFTKNAKEALDWCKAKNISGCGFDFPEKTNDEIQVQSGNFNGFAPFDYKSHIEYLTKSSQICYKKVIDYTSISSVLGKTYVRFIPAEQGGGCSAGFENFICQGTKEYTDAVQNLFSFDGKSYPQLVDEGKCISDSAQAHELTHRVVYGTPLEEMKGLNEGLADYIRDKVSIDPPNLSCQPDGYIIGYEPKQSYVDLNKFQFDSSYYHTGECIWKYIEDNYGHKTFTSIMHKLDDLRFKTGKYFFFQDIVTPIIDKDILPSIKAQFNLSEDLSSERNF